MCAHCGPVATIKTLAQYPAHCKVADLCFRPSCQATSLQQSFTMSIPAECQAFAVTSQEFKDCIFISYTFHYHPSVAAAVAFAVLFALATCALAFRTYRHKNKWMWILVFTGCCEVAGYVARIVAALQPRLVPFLFQSLFLLLPPILFALGEFHRDDRGFADGKTSKSLAPHLPAPRAAEETGRTAQAALRSSLQRPPHPPPYAHTRPPCYCRAVNYSTMGRLLSISNEKAFGIMPQRIARFFLASDFTTLFIQCSGGGMMVAQSLARMGSAIALVGLIVQLCFFAAFCGVIYVSWTQPKYGLRGTGKDSVQPAMVGMVVTISLM